MDGQNFDFKEFFLDTGHLSSIQKMKIFERLLDKFLIFAQFIQIDAIVGGYEAQKHRNALRNHFKSIKLPVRMFLKHLKVSHI